MLVDGTGRAQALQGYGTYRSVVLSSNPNIPFSCEAFCRTWIA